ncbi:uncharacterized protein LOC132035867 isoform X1 [Lycium ferocissimum]|uniref:uncharacterized protein LOC132035867 isoform X1 n=1 Tax=Lycium ferocissimum TaxID=112874 RepID=UPI0028152B4F|nr:uncharacterized protein LOC132035867 isoform X1 [Lycium ferocissimum]
MSRKGLLMLSLTSSRKLLLLPLPSKRRYFSRWELWCFRFKREEPITSFADGTRAELQICYNLISKTSSRRLVVADDPKFGLACLGKINMTYESDRDLMIRFYEFVAKEEMACEEAELGPDRFAERLTMQQNLQEQQLEMLKYMRSFHMDDQSAILEKIHQQLEKANFDTEASVLTVEQMQDVVRRRVSPLFQPR